MNSHIQTEPSSNQSPKLGSSAQTSLFSLYDIEQSLKTQRMVSSSQLQNKAWGTGEADTQCTISSVLDNLAADLLRSKSQILVDCNSALVGQIYQSKASSLNTRNSTNPLSTHIVEDAMPSTKQSSFLPLHISEQDNLLEPLPLPAEVSSVKFLSRKSKSKRMDIPEAASRICKKPKNLGNQESSSDIHVHDDASSNFFRAYQAEQWTENFEKLCDYVKSHGHCQVPHKYNEDPALARWVKRQRYQHKLKLEGKPSTMTDERIAVLEKIGFVWDSHIAAWEQRINELMDYRSLYGHCNVPSSYPQNRQLAVWVKRQRRQYKFFGEGRPSNMSQDRIEALERIGFEWELRCRDSK